MIGNNFAKIAAEEERRAQKKKGSVESPNNPLSLEQDKLNDQKFAQMKEEIQMSVFRAVQKAQSKKMDANIWAELKYVLFLFIYIYIYI